MTQLFYETMNLQDTYIAPPPAGQYNPLGTEFIECDTDLSKIYCFGTYILLQSGLGSLEI